jgi:hypothetical protein
MTLKILQPQTITAANITATNVALETLWTAGTYNLGDRRRYNDMLWEVSAATTTQTPSDTATEWFSLGPANRYRAFDQQIGLDQYRVIETVTANADSITYTLDGLGQIMGIAMFGLVCDQIHIVATDVTPGDILDLTYDMQDSTQYNGSFWRWAFLPKAFETKYVNFEAYIARDATIEITISNIGATAEVAAIVMGVVTEFGDVEDGASRSIRSRSIIKTEGTLTSLVRRLPSSAVSFDVFLRNYQASVFWPLIEDLDGVAAVYAGPDANAELVTYGFHTNANTTAMVNGFSRVKLEVQSL